ncbi:hypothetical protein Salat_1865900 [Sesamum alatum]|uniref:Uncharacterized protein n=1 Tax=Sesamum alatum TaxID=300844 RepID=A0AAE1Y414_9LAMI|nr:hypothetical protein Salat_1865900 [Sesamum alatum]
MWLRHPGFLAVVEDSWRSPVQEQSLLKLRAKLNRLKQCLKIWNKEVLGDIFQAIAHAEAGVQVAERNYDASPTDANLIAMNRSTTILQQALAVEEDIWRQESLCKSGGPASKFFRAYWRPSRVQLISTSPL